MSERSASVFLYTCSRSSILLHSHFHMRKPKHSNMTLIIFVDIVIFLCSLITMFCLTFMKIDEGYNTPTSLALPLINCSVRLFPYGLHFVQKRSYSPSSCTSCFHSLEGGSSATLVELPASSCDAEVAMRRGSVMGAI